MSKFKKGDKVKVKAGKSSNSKKLDGKIGVVTKEYSDYCCLDIGKGEGGIWDRELELIPPVELKVGDRVEFIFDGDIKIIPDYHSATIPSRLIVHGSTEVGDRYRKNKAKIVNIYKEYFIVEYDDDNNRKVRLGFKKEVLRLIKPNQKSPTHIILWNANFYIAYRKKDRDEKIKELVDNKEVDNNDITIFDIKNESKVVCDIIIEEIK